ncbi:predicted protein [Botrytis cinerea T4]|uniref:Uncharacterized protein n=1 Tax=Botryotinia fuckeliana (strain T4) TaxID=999810 RepID=G2YM01_BOTF4|nr:predicted protein [Botrytis cinerea T4]
MNDQPSDWISSKEKIETANELIRLDHVQPRNLCTRRKQYGQMDKNWERR